MKNVKEKERKELEELTIKFAKVQQFEPLFKDISSENIINIKLENERKLKVEKLKMKKIENKRLLFINYILLFFFIS